MGVRVPPALHFPHLRNIHVHGDEPTAEAHAPAAGPAGRRRRARRPQALRARCPTAPTEKRTTAPQFLREVRGELRKVAWPTRAEVVNYSIIVLVAIVLLTAYVAFLDYGFGDVLLKLFSR